jgi:hypothetical protein
MLFVALLLVEIHVGLPILATRGSLPRGSSSSSKPAAA